MTGIEQKFFFVLFRFFCDLENFIWSRCDEKLFKGNPLLFNGCVDQLQKFPRKI